MTLCIGPIPSHITLPGYAEHQAYLRDQGLPHHDPGRAEPRRGDWSGAILTGALLDGALLDRASLVGARLDDASLRDARLDDASLDRARLDGARLDGASLEGACLEGACLDRANFDGACLVGACLDRASGLPRLCDDPMALRHAVADHIEAHPELHAQEDWGDGSDDPECATPCCVAGRACHLGGGTHGYDVATAATLLMHVDGHPMPPFSADASREEILAALRS